MLWKVPNGPRDWCWVRSRAVEAFAWICLFVVVLRSCTSCSPVRCCPVSSEVTPSTSGTKTQTADGKARDRWRHRMTVTTDYGTWRRHLSTVATRTLFDCYFDAAIFIQRFDWITGDEGFIVEWFQLSSSIVETLSIRLWDWHRFSEKMSNLINLVRWISTEWSES